MSDVSVRVLLAVEDALDRRAILRFIQNERLPYEVVAVGSFAEAGAMLTRRAFDVAIFDQRLGDGVGIDLLPDLIGTPAIILARSGDETVAAQAVRAGAYGLLVQDSGRRYVTLLAATVTSALDRRRAEIAAARRAEDLLRTHAEFQRLASMMWHEIIGPLTTLLGTVEMLQVDAEQRSSPPETLATVKQTVAIATHLERLVTDVLGYYRLQTPPTLVTVDLGRLLADVVATFPGSMWHDATVDVANIPPVSGDPVRLRTLFRQLLDGAHRLGGPDPLAVRLCAYESNDHLRICVSSNGVGRPVAVPDPGPEDPCDEESGLGMAICRRIVEQHGGRIWIESGGDGTTVHVTLAKASVPVQRPAATGAAE